MAKMKDEFSNKAYGTVTESAANTLTFSEVRTNISIFEKVAWVIHRIEWHLTQATYGLLADGSDNLNLALTGSDAIASLGLEIPAVIDLYNVFRVHASGVGFAFNTMPLVRDLSSLPGGGLIVAPRPLFVAIHGESLLSAATAEVRFYFTQRALAADEYLDLIDFYRIVV